MIANEKNAFGLEKSEDNRVIHNFSALFLSRQVMGSSIFVNCNGCDRVQFEELDLLLVNGFSKNMSTKSSRFLFSVLWVLNEIRVLYSRNTDSNAQFWYNVALQRVF